MIERKKLKSWRFRVLHSTVLQFAWDIEEITFLIMNKAMIFIFFNLKFSSMVFIYLFLLLHNEEGKFVCYGYTYIWSIYLINMRKKTRGWQDCFRTIFYTSPRNFPRYLGSDCFMNEEPGFQIWNKKSFWLLLNFRLHCFTSSLPQTDKNNSV